MIAGLLVSMGSLGDRIGRKRILLIGATAFGLVSVLNAYATTPEMMIAARALLGVAGATLMPATLALIRNIFHDPRERSLAVGIWGATRPRAPPWVRSWAASCWSTSGGVRSSSSTCR